MVLTLLKLSIALSVFAIGLQATLSDATYLFRHPRELVRALVSMYVVMPVVAVALVMTFNLHPAVKIALVTLAVSPVPPIFPKKAVKAGGQDNYSVGLLVATGILAIADVPITIDIFQAIGGVPLQMSLGSIALLVFTSILVPLLAGIVLAAGAFYLLTDGPRSHRQPAVASRAAARTYSRFALISESPGASSAARS